MRSQMEGYKETCEANVKLIAELRCKIESLIEDKQKLGSEKEDLARKSNEAQLTFTKELESLKSINEQLNVKLNQQEVDLKAVTNADKVALDLARAKLKKVCQMELEKMKKSNEIECQQHLNRIDSLEKSLKSLEEEFRSALIIESNRYAELFAKYEQANKESLQTKVNYQQLEASDERNKCLIKELNELIKEQKSRLQTLAKLRKETSDDVQKRADKLNEAVADCGKLKLQLEAVKKDKTKLEGQLKYVASQYKQIETEKTTWTQRFNEQKALLSHEIGRLTVENQTISSEAQILRKQLDKEVDNVKIKAKIIEDQTETLRKLKSGLVERDSLLKEARDEALKTQKSLEKQLNAEMDQANELHIKYEKVCERKEELKLELEEARQLHEETKLAYEELTNKWRQKSELITDLDAKVRKMKENYEEKERLLVSEAKQLRDDAEMLNERLRKVDDEFRRQYDVEKREHMKIMEKTRGEYEAKLKEANERTQDIEQEMRQLLVETANKKKFYDEKIKSFSSVFQKIQADFGIDS